MNALRAFEAAARHLSLKKAAEELNVTPAAVSHQIQQLEDALDAQLFYRKHRGVALTEIAQIFIPKLQEGFDCLYEAMAQMRERRGADTLSISTAPSFAALWLMPRLHNFVTDHPEIDVQVSTRIRQFARFPRGQSGDVESVTRWADESDVVIMFGNGGYPGMKVDHLLPLSISPLCATSMLTDDKGQPVLKTPEDLRNQILLHDERGMLYEGRSFWDTWLEAAGVKGIDTSHGQRFSHSTLALEAAMAGRGVVASTLELSTGAISRGHLVAPFPLAVKLASSYFLVSTHETSQREVVKMFRAWLLESIAKLDNPSE